MKSTAEPASWKRRRKADQDAHPIELERKLDPPIYFAHPYPSWERGTSENANGLLRQYLPKSADLSQVTPDQLRAIVHALNRRPRKCLDFQNPFEVFHAKPSESFLRQLILSGTLSPLWQRTGLCREAARAPSRPRGRGNVV